MIRLKSEEDIKRLAEGGRVLAGILDRLGERAVVGVVPEDLDVIARDLIDQADCKPAFLNYAPKGQEPYPAALCVSVNEAVVHGLPSSVPFQSGDVVGLDLGLVYENKYYLDSARTVGVGEVSAMDVRLMEVTGEALRLGIEAAQVGSRVGDIGSAIQKYVEAEGFNVVRQLVGHGVGFDVHEQPQVPNFGKAGRGEKLEEGLVIAIEPMVTTGDAGVVTGSDGWTVNIAAGGTAAHEEHTVAVTAEGPRVLTQALR